MQMNFRGQVAFIAGAASESSLAIARALGDAGAKIALADEAAHKLEEVGARLRDQGIEVLTLVGAPSDRADMRRAAEAVVSHFGKVHLLIANAEFRSVAPLADTSKADWDKAYAVNVGVFVNLLQEFLPILLRQQEGGHILARTPISGIVGGGSDGARTVHARAVAAVIESLFGELRAQSVGSSLLITSDEMDGDGSGDSKERAKELGARVARGIAQNEVFIFADPVAPETIRNYFAPLLAAMPQAAVAGGAAPGGDSEEMFPTYAAVLRAKGVTADV